MRSFSLVAVLFLFPVSAMAQSFQGTFAIPTSNGAITLTLAPQGSGYAGTLVGDDGGTFQVQGEMEGEALVGAVFNEGGGAGFEAYVEGDQLRFILVPVDAAMNPNYAAAQEFMLTRQAGSSAAPGVATAPAQAGPGSGVGGPLGGPVAGGTGGGLAGVYSGAINGTPSRMTLQLNGGALQGEIDASGYRYVLNGQAQGARASGTMNDPQTGGTLQFEAGLEGDQLTLTILAPNPQTGQVTRMPVVFQRGEGAAAGGTMGGAGGQTGGVAGRGGANDGFERDPALIGMWTHSESMSSGQFSGVSQVQMQINPDGTYLYGNGRFVGGGPGISGDSGTGGDVTRGQWRTQDRIVYIMEPGVGQWTPYARYYVEGARMMFTFGDGSKQIWYRQ